MAPETLSRVFEPFYQVRANPGTLGLGLAIVQYIVERHGGNVRASSAGPGEGSTFVVGLPLHFDPA
jgi:signal transduction histidine kinase